MEYNFSKVGAALNLDKKWVLKQIDDSLIYFHYFGRFEIGKAYRSFFDKKDTRPSTVFFVSNRTGRIIYYDFRTEEKMDCFGFVQRAFYLSFKDALEKIASDFGLIDKSTCKVSEKTIEQAKEVDKCVKKSTLIQFEPEEWNSGNLAYWRLYDITQEELLLEQIYTVKKLYLNHQEIFNPKNYLRYAYVQTYGINSKGVKIYSPEDPNMKWLSSLPLDVPFGMDVLPHISDTIIITKSQKDRLVLLKLFTDVIAVQNESEASLNKETRQELNRDYSRKVVIFDNDEVGVRNSKKYNEKGYDYFNIPKAEYDKHGIKDCSDYVRAYGIEALEDLCISKGLLVPKR